MPVLSAPPDAHAVGINFDKDKKTFAFAVIIIKQLFSMNIKSIAESEAPCNVVLENITDYAY